MGLMEEKPLKVVKVRKLCKYYFYFKLVIGMCMSFSVFKMYGHQYEGLRGLRPLT